MDSAAADRILEELRQGYAAVPEADAVHVRERHYWRELERFADYVREGEAVLEVGCGPGRAAELFLKKGAAYAGVDLSPRLIGAARDRWKEQAAFVVGDLLDLPVDDGRYDAVIAAAAIQHIPSEAYRLKAFGELARVTRPGGYVFLAVWRLWRPRYWRVLFHQRLGRKNGWDFGDLKIGRTSEGFARYHHAFRAAELRRLCRTAGLEIAEQSVSGETLVTIAKKP